MNAAVTRRTSSGSGSELLRIRSHNSQKDSDDSILTRLNQSCQLVNICLRNGGTRHLAPMRRVEVRPFGTTEAVEEQRQSPDLRRRQRIKGDEESHYANPTPAS